MDKALELEERNLAWKEGGVGNFQRSGGVSKGVTSYKSSGLVKKIAGPSSASYGEKGDRARVEGGEKGDRARVEGGGERRRAEPRRLSQEERQDRQCWGLCFKCGEHWGRDHVCPMQKMQLMLVEEEEEEGEGGG